MTSYTYKRSSTLCVSKTVSKLCMCISERNAAHSLLCRDPVPALQSCWVLTRGSVVRLSTFPVCWTPRLQTDGQQLCSSAAVHRQLQSASQWPWHWECNAERTLTFVLNTTGEHALLWKNLYWPGGILWWPHWQPDSSVGGHQVCTWWQSTCIW